MDGLVRQVRTIGVLPYASMVCLEPVGYPGGLFMYDIGMCVRVYARHAVWRMDVTMDSCGGFYCTGRVLATIRYVQIICAPCRCFYSAVLVDLTHFEYTAFFILAPWLHRISVARHDA